jgi:hypothetical protein
LDAFSGGEAANLSHSHSRPDMSRFSRIKGMVTVGGVTYRIERVDRGRYAVFSVVDDTKLGTFRALSPIAAENDATDPALLERVGRMAIQSGRTSSVFNETPPPATVAPNVDAAEEEAPLTPLRRAPA